MRGSDLNYHHLFYFWVVAREGSLTAASRSLGVAPSTVSGQLKELEAHFGQALFDRSGRSLSLTAQGELALEYAEQIFALGSELDDVLLHGRAGRPVRLRVGVADLVPKLVVRRLLDPSLDLEGGVQLHVYGDRGDRLVADLALHHVDLVIATGAVSAMADRSAHMVELGTSTLSLFGRRDLVANVLSDFPASLDGAPMLLPPAGTQPRRVLDGWFDARGVVPLTVAELADSGLLKAFGAAGRGLFAAPSFVAEEIERTYGVFSVGELEGLTETYRAIMPAREPMHPAVQRIIEKCSVSLERRAARTAGD